MSEIERAKAQRDGLLKPMRPGNQAAGSGLARSEPVSGMSGIELPAVGDYVLATKYEDGDPGDMWALGFYDGVRDDQGRHYVKDAAGNQIRGNGFRKVARIRADVGRWLLEVAAQQLERCPPGTVNLWTMLTERAFDLEQETDAAAIRRGSV